MSSTTIAGWNRHLAHLLAYRKRTRSLRVFGSDCQGPQNPAVGTLDPVWYIFLAISELDTVEQLAPLKINSTISGGREDGIYEWQPKI
jgi:hypothetical protein